MELAGRRNEKVKELQAKFWKTTFCFGAALAARKRKSGKRVEILCGNREHETGTCRMTPALSLQRKITDNPVWKCVCKTSYDMRRKRPSYRMPSSSSFENDACYRVKLNPNEIKGWGKRDCLPDTRLMLLNDSSRSSAGRGCPLRFSDNSGYTLAWLHDYYI